MGDIRLTIVRIGAGFFGILGLILGGKFVLQGVTGTLGDALATIPDPAVLAALDNHFRFVAGVWFLISLALLLAAILMNRKPEMAHTGAQIGFEALIVGGIARLVGIGEFGGQPSFYAATFIEIVPPLILLIMLKMHQKSQRT